MEKYIRREEIYALIKMLNSAKIRYVLPKNIGEELPDRLKCGKDIDLIVHPDDKMLLEKIMMETYIIERHPCGVESGWSFLYGMQPPDFWSKKTINGVVYIDVFFVLSCHSLIERTWIPLSIEIQERMWENRVWDKKNKWWTLDIDTEYVYLIVRSIFDKGEFTKLYKERITSLQVLIDKDIVYSLMREVFFKYTDRLFELLEAKKFDFIRSDYLSFNEY